MFHGYIILLAIPTAFFSVLLLEPLEARGMIRSTKVLTVIATLASVYCIAAGIQLLAGWQDPFADATGDQLGRASVQGRGGGGIVVLAIRYLPWFLIGAGVFLGYNWLQIGRRIWGEARLGS